MSRRAWAIVISVPLLVALWVAAALVPVPYVTFHPGLTVDVLAEQSGQERIQVEGHEAYYADDGGELRMTTVSVTPPRERVTIFEALDAWLSDEDSVEPYSAVYEEGETPEESELQSSVSMLSSQDTAVAAALRDLGFELDPTVEVYSVTEDAPADGVFEVRDQILAVDGEPVDDPRQVVKAVGAVEPGEPVGFTVLRDGERRQFEVAPEMIDGRSLIGIVPASGYEFPFEVRININPRIGGPSAGLMFALAIYDVLTPGSFTEGNSIAGTGTIDAEGNVGPIGGIQQKVVGARASGAELFLVPAANCEDALGAPNGDMRLVRVSTLTEARQAVQDWVEDPTTDLPSCEEQA